MHLVTGATGFLGRQILVRLLFSGAAEKVAVVVRPRLGLSGEMRVRQTLQDLLEVEDVSSLLARIEVYEGDLSLPQFGLGSATFANLGTRLSTITHAAADTTLDRPYEEAQRINVGATEQVVALANIAAQNSSFFTRLNHISTAYVAGDSKCTVGEDDLSLDCGFRNSYEKTKAEAEALVRGQNTFAFTVFRPSVVVGDSVTGQTSAFNVIYVPARYLAKGLFKAVPAIPNTPFDVVPVDYVANAIIALQHHTREGNYSYHLTAGLGRESSPKEIIEAIFAAVNNYFRRGRHNVAAPPWLAPETITKIFNTVSLAAHTVFHFEEVVAKNIMVIKQILPFLPYMISNPRFDDTNTRQALVGRLEQVPLFTDYAERIFGYCLQTNWGRKPWTNPLGVPTLRRRLALLD